MSWSLQDYCAGQRQTDLLALPESTQAFLSKLNLPSSHPFCSDDGPQFQLEGVPPMGALGMERFETQSCFEVAITLWFMIAPPLLAMTELWLRLLAGVIGPMGTFYLTIRLLGNKPVLARENRKNQTNTLLVSSTVIFTVASSSVVMTDTLYCLENGPYYGALLFVAATAISLQTCVRNNLSCAATLVFFVVLVSIYLIWDEEGGRLVFGNKVDHVEIREGLYYNHNNDLVSRVVENWPQRYRSYNKAHGASRWMPTGDSRTGIPFLINHLPNPTWTRFFLEVDDDEYVALDFSFPENGHHSQQPLYLVLHGLNGGSSEEYVRDLTIRRNQENSTVVVMVARGLMDLPIRGWSIFNGARTSDAHAASVAVRRALGNQLVVGVGYSMGAIVLSNYVASYGDECALDGAVSISGGLDMRYQEHFVRAQRLWQPMLAETLRDDFLLGKWGYRVRQKLRNDEFLRVLRASHVTDIDRFAVVPYNGFESLDHYYREMSVLGDIPHDENGMLPMRNEGKIHNISIPLVVVHAFDDPLVTWRSTCQNSGFMHPEKLIKTGNGNLILLLTKAGGHVGWPLGLIPTKEKWRWMSDIAMSFALSLHTAKGATFTQ